MYSCIGLRQVTRGKAKSGAVVKHQRNLVVLKTTSNVKVHFKSSFAPLYRSLVTSLGLNLEGIVIYMYMYYSVENTTINNSALYYYYSLLMMYSVRIR